MSATTPTAREWVLLAREYPPRIDANRWREHARSLLGIAVDAGNDARVVLADERLKVRVFDAVDVVVNARAIDEAQRARGERAAAAIGGAGFDALVAAARSVWTVIAPDGRDDAAIALCATLAMVLLAPVVPPEGDAIFGFQGARARWEKSRRG